jgi:hypothetical protein
MGVAVHETRADRHPGAVYGLVRIVRFPDLFYPAIFYEDACIFQNPALLILR